MADWGCWTLGGGLRMMVEDGGLGMDMYMEWFTEINGKGMVD